MTVLTMACDRCGRRLGKHATHYLLEDCGIVCARCLGDLDYPPAAACTRIAVAFHLARRLSRR